MSSAISTHPPWPSWPSDAPWPPHVMPGIGCDDRGLVVGAGTRLVRMGDKGRLSVEPDAARCIALLSMLSRRPLGAEILRPIEAAAAYWAAGDKALANLRLVFSGLPRLGSLADADCLQAAASCLDRGLAPRDLMKALDLDPSVLDLRKYDPDQPRVPAGSGRESGRWTSGADEAGTNERGREASALQPSSTPPYGDWPPPTSSIMLVAADGPLIPKGIEVIPRTSVDPLDPQGLNAVLSLAEQQAIADTLNKILANNPNDLPTLNPHPYENRTSKRTGAVLPLSTSGYTTYYVRSTGAPPGTQRIIMDNRGSIYYTNNHYFSFYPVDIKMNPTK